MSQAMMSANRGPLLAAARFALEWDRQNPDRAGDYPDFWRERIERARAAGFNCDDERADRDYWRAYDAQVEQGVATTTAPPDPAPVAASTLPLEDPFADDEPQGVPDPMRGWME